VVVVVVVVMIVVIVAQNEIGWGGVNWIALLLD